MLARSYLVGREVEPVVHSQEHNSPRAVLAILIHFFPTALFFIAPTVHTFPSMSDVSDDDEAAPHPLFTATGQRRVYGLFTRTRGRTHGDSYK